MSDETTSSLKQQGFWNGLAKPFFVLAPMEGVTDIVFRQVVARAGAPDVWYTEFTNATGWVHAGDKAIGGRLLRADHEWPIVAQIWGGNPGDMTALAGHCKTLGFDGIDINMGCPAKSAIKSGGAALIRQPELAAGAIQAAKTAGLPVSVKTRLGYTHVDEWREWLKVLLEQDIAALTVHLRTKKEMSKVPAHHELIPDIKALRDATAPQTLLVINGDVETRAQGEALVKKYGVDGVMIGRGVFKDPFCFCKKQRHETTDATQKTPPRTLLSLLHYHLDLYDQYGPQTKRPYDTLKRFFKIYVRDFDGAAEVRDRLMHTKTTGEARVILDQFGHSVLH